jgi:hypothetical protein
MFDSVFSIIGIKPQIRMNKRYLVDSPSDLEGFAAQYNCVIQHIEQTYLKSRKSGAERRVRRIQNGRNANDIAYYYTERDNVEGGVLTRREYMPHGEREYIRLILQADPLKNTVTKTRYAFTANNQHLILDVYPEDKYPQLHGKAMLELKEIEKAGQGIIVPKGLSILQDVSDDSDYAIATLASK